MGWTTEKSWFDSRQRQEMFLVFETSRPAMQFLQLSVEQAAVDLLQRLTEPGREGDY
jgi:hypothetical protein